jgi:hypothetical protein
MRFGGGGPAAGLESSGPGWEMLVYSLALFLGAWLAWAWTPELQHPPRARGRYSRPSRTLEDLAQGRAVDPVQGRVRARRGGVRVIGGGQDGGNV